MKKVQVLLSSYNGQKYIRQQLDSIFNQEGVEVHCLVRDDGSTDGTTNILSEYQNVHKNMDVVHGNNIGYKASFMELVKMSGEYDYYAFADQDDVWKPNKLLKAIEKICDEEQDKAVMYCSNCTVVDSSLNYVSMLHTKDNIIPDSKIRALFQGFAHGCTMVFNRNARDLIIRLKTGNVYSHDFIIPIIILFLGKVVYDKNSYILYRQHEENYFGSKQSISKIIKAKIKQLKVINFYSGMINDILNEYVDLLSENDYKMLKRISEYKGSLNQRISLLFDKEIRRSTIRGTLFLKGLILFSRF